MDKIRLTIICIFTVALLPRLFLAFSSCEVPTYDAGEYDVRGLNLLEGKGFSVNGIADSYREPLYPLFLMFIYRLFGHSYMAVRIVQSVLGALICVIIFLISRKIFDYKVALISGSIACFNPGFIKITEHLLSENLYIFLLVIAIYFFVKQTQEKKYKDLVLSGVILGLTALTRAVIFFFPLFVIICMGRNLIGRNYIFKKQLLGIAIFLFFFILPIAPWTIRNWRLEHRFIPIVSRTGWGLYSCYLPKEGKIFGVNTDDETIRKASLIKSYVESDAFLLRETIKYIRNHPLRVLKLEILKVAYFWSPFDWEVIAYGIYNFMFGFIFPFFIYAVFINHRRIREFLPLYLPIIYSFLVALVTYGSPRFRLPVEPFIIPVASLGILNFSNKIKNKMHAIFLISIYFLINCVFYSNSAEIKLFTKWLFEKIGLW